MASEMAMISGVVRPDSPDMDGVLAMAAWIWLAVRPVRSPTLPLPRPLAVWQAPQLVTNYWDPDRASTLVRSICQ